MDNQKFKNLRMGDLVKNKDRPDVYEITLIDKNTVSARLINEIEIDVTEASDWSVVQN